MKMNSTPYRDGLRSFDEMPEELQQALIWVYGDDAAQEMLVPETVIEARQNPGEEPRPKCIVPKVFIRSDGLFVIRDERGQEVTRGETNQKGLRFYMVGDYQNWAHVKVYQHFVSQVPPGYKVTFIDGDPGNAALSNLALVPREIEETNGWSHAA